MKFLAALVLVSATLHLYTTSPTPTSISTDGPWDSERIEKSFGDKKAKKCDHQCPHATNSTNSNDYLCGDSRLGPIQLPTHLPLSALTATYDRFEGLCPEEFLAKWTVNGTYFYPPHDGFLLANSHMPIAGNVTLEVGRQIDRFGSEYGTFTSPAKAPYSERALPPSNLDTPVGADGKPGRYPYNYHIYEVKKPFVVLAGPIAPWFGQPGMGTQYKMSKSVLSYINSGFLKRVDTKDA